MSPGRILIGWLTSRKEAKLFVAAIRENLRRSVRIAIKKALSSSLRGGVFNDERGDTLKIAMRTAGCAGTKKISTTRGSEERRCPVRTCGGKLSLISSCRMMTNTLQRNGFNESVPLVFLRAVQKRYWTRDIAPVDLKNNRRFIWQ